MIRYKSLSYTEKVIQTITIPKNMIQDGHSLVVNDTPECSAFMEFVFNADRLLDICLEGKEITTCVIERMSKCNLEMVNTVLQKIGIELLKLPEFERADKILHIHNIDQNKWKLFLALAQKGIYRVEHSIETAIIHHLKPSQTKTMRLILDNLGIEKVESLNIYPLERIDNEMIKLIYQKFLSLGKHGEINLSIHFSRFSTGICCSNGNLFSMNYGDNKKFTNLHKVLLDSFKIRKIYLNCNDSLDVQKVEIIRSVLTFSVAKIIKTDVFVPKHGPVFHFLRNQNFHENESVTFI